MRKVLTIAGKELRSYFVSPMAYVVLGFYLAVVGLIFCLNIGLPRVEASMAPYFGAMLFMTMVVTPVLTMGLLAQEQASGSIELLMTNPVRDTEVVLGKYLGAVALFALVLVGTLEFPLILEIFGEPDWGIIFAGYLGMLLAGMAFLAIGMFASSVTANQIAAVVIASIILFGLWLIGFLQMVGGEGSTIGEVARYISTLENYQDFPRGILDTRPIIYYVSLIILALTLTVRALDNRRTL